VKSFCLYCCVRLNNIWYDDLGGHSQATDATDSHRCAELLFALLERNGVVHVVDLCLALSVLCYGSKVTCFFRRYTTIIHIFLLVI
jgi:hypothetical protein